MIENLHGSLLTPPALLPAQSERAVAGRAPRPESTQNSLLAAVSRTEYRRLLGMLEPVTLTFGDVLYEPGDVISHVYFPGVSLVSLLTLVDHHLALEVGLVGREGMVGIPLALGVGVSSTRALVQGAGVAMRMKSAHFLKELGHSLPLQRAILRYTHALMAQVARTAACNRFHVVEERLARWLLMTQDRAHSTQFRVTHEFLSYMLGVRRVGITAAAGALQRSGLVEYHRGEMTVLDRSGLEATACACYAADRQAYADHLR